MHGFECNLEKTCTSKLYIHLFTVIMRNFKAHIDINYSFILIPQRVYSVVIANTKVRETYACYKYT